MGAPRRQLKSSESRPFQKPGDTSSPRSTILLVDPDEDSRDQLTVDLRTRGWHVIVASDVRTAVERAAAEQPLAIISDLVLPDAQGYQFARTFQTMIEHDIAMIGLSRAGASEHEAALAAGFHVVFDKPVDVDALDRYLQTRVKT